MRNFREFEGRSRKKGSTLLVSQDCWRVKRPLLLSSEITVKIGRWWNPTRNTKTWFVRIRPMETSWRRMNLVTSIWRPVPGTSMLNDCGRRSMDKMLRWREVPDRLSKTNGSSTYLEAMLDWSDACSRMKGCKSALVSKAEG